MTKILLTMFYPKRKKKNIQWKSVQAIRTFSVMKISISIKICKISQNLISWKDFIISHDSKRNGYTIRYTNIRLELKPVSCIKDRRIWRDVEWTRI